METFVIKKDDKYFAGAEVDTPLVPDMVDNFRNARVMSASFAKTLNGYHFLGKGEILSWDDLAKEEKTIQKD